MKAKLPAPAPTDLPFSLGRLGPWSILGRDALGKRAVAQCSHCRAVKEISIADGSIASCGCGAETFAATVAAAAHTVGLRRRARS
jgi:hypothetical protein